MNEYLIYSLIGLAGVALRHYFPQLAKYIPGGPAPSPAPAPIPAPSPAPQPTPTPAGPAADRPLLDCLAWLGAAKAGAVKIDDQDVRTMVAIKPLLDEMLKA